VDHSLFIFPIILFSWITLNNDYTVCIKRQTVSYLVFRRTLHDVRITPLGAENNINKANIKKKIAKLQIKFQK